ncbi:uncharacterized protein TNCV_561791 [Trichonephila clavipes]|uniref:Uncharacterized protein n=1 Tax=Trichonephila clavipes TaxID=2585209 RepID=A0A8X6V507_TRICX|nr:uncharacterized protein TNCV_561791 [Trichonephila clavipes]
MTVANEELLTYLELYSIYKAFINISWKQLSLHQWYLSQCPGASISFKGEQRDQTTFARLFTGHLKSPRFSHGAKSFLMFTKCNDAEVTPQDLLDCVDLVRDDLSKRPILVLDLLRVKKFIDLV